jgi:hypothetical protein
MDVHGCRRCRRATLMQSRGKELPPEYLTPGCTVQNPVALQGVATCMANINATCVPGQAITTPSETEPSMPPYFVAVPGRIIPVVGTVDPRQKCDTASYTVDTDFTEIATPLATMCIAHCIAVVQGCTGAQWLSAGGGCTLWYLVLPTTYVRTEHV